MESELRTKLIKEKKKKREWYQDEANIRESRRKNSDTDNSTENVSRTDRGMPKVKKNPEKSFQVFHARKPRAFSNAGSTDPEEIGSKSMDIVVDIHREHNVSRRRENIEDVQVMSSESSRNHESFKVFSETEASRNRRKKLETRRSKTSLGMKEDRDDIEVVESEDLIEAFCEEETAFLDSNRFPEEKPSRKQWGVQEVVQEAMENAEPKKPVRKRWSKDATVIRLPETKGTWGISSKKDLRIQKRPSITTRKSIKQKLSGVDNAAFVPENEEILRIETDHENTRIEMTEVIDDMEVAESGDGNSQESEEEKLNKITINQEISKDMFKEDVDEKRETIVDIESLEEESTEGEKIEDKTETEDIEETEENGEMDSESSTASESSEKFEARKRTKIHRRRRDDLEDSDRRTLSTTEDDLERSAKEKRSKKKKTARKSISSSSTHTEETKKKTITKYISIIIHRADMLELDYMTRHPMVKVHIVNVKTGKYLENDQGGYLQPMITGKFDFKKKMSIIPVWNEELVFEHDFDAILKTDEQVIILFEIIDLLSFAEASFNYDKFGHEGCWYKIAWAFLRPLGTNGLLHINKNVRLQLYKPPKNFKKFERFQTCEVYTWWKSRREKYFSSLFVTVSAIDPLKLEPILYQQLSLHDISDVRSESQKISARASDSIHLPKWTRLAAQSCKIPNESLFDTEHSEGGCSFVAFSNNGKYLACSFSEEQDYPIVVYEIEGKNIHTRFSGHKTFVYSLNWSRNDDYLLSVSSDQTARVWDVQNQIIQHVEIMQHPLYVYCGKFDPESAAIVATGCYDRIARIWVRNKKSKNRDVIQKLEGHEGFINSMCFQKNSNLLTADSIGVIILWTVKKSRRASIKKEWHISRKIRVKEIDGIVINTIVLHPLESRLLVHSRNNGLRILDLATGVVLRRFHGLNNQKIQITACVSPCGGLIFCGGEDSSLSAWNLETGSLLAKYSFDRSVKVVICVDYHPYDHVLAYSTFGGPSPVKIIRFNKDATGEDVGLKMLQEAENRAENTSTRLLNDTMTKEKSYSRLHNQKTLSEESFKDKSFLPGKSSSNQRFASNESLLDISDKNEKMRRETLDAKSKFSRLSIEKTKSRSASRLYSITEKIDRILSYASRSPCDLESGRNFVQDVSNISARRDVEADKEERRESMYSGAGDCSSLYFGSKGKRDEAFEMEVLERGRIANRDVKKRSRSAKQSRSKEYEDNVNKVLSDSAANYRKAGSFDPGEITSPETAVSSFIIERRGNETDERNSDEDSIKLLGNKGLSDVENDSSDAKRSESGSSVLSNATFTIENEIPIPQPRRKKNPV